MLKNALDPQGNGNIPLNPLSLAITMGAPFVARGFAGDRDHLKELIKAAVLFRGTALLDILQPCVSFNKVNTYQWYSDRVFKVENPLTDRYEALKTADLWGEKIPIGILYVNRDANCRDEKKIFRQQIAKGDIEAQLNMSCVMMR
jgi:2-oxoglutarate ferredoxin oxidoreductase subunit beta